MGNLELPNKLTPISACLDQMLDLNLWNNNAKNHATVFKEVTKEDLTFWKTLNVFPY